MSSNNYNFRDWGLQTFRAEIRSSCRISRPEKKVLRSLAGNFGQMPTSGQFDFQDFRANKNLFFLFVFLFEETVHRKAVSATWSKVNLEKSDKFIIKKLE